MGLHHSEEAVVYHFFTETEFFTESEAVITGPDVNHIKNVLRMKPGEQILLSDGKGTNCLCEITEIENSRVLARILPELVEDTELPVEVTLYQGLPKGDKMEFIIQKCVELGAEIAIVVGGGNFWRGRSSGEMERTRADQIGMLATAMNGPVGGKAG